MAMRDWVDVPAIQAISRHFSGVVVALVAFLLVGLIIHFGLYDGVLKQMLEIIDGSILVGLVLVLAWKLFRLLTTGDPGGGHFLVA